MQCPNKMQFGFRPLTFVGGLVQIIASGNEDLMFQTPYICRGFSSVKFVLVTVDLSFRPLTFVGGLVLDAIEGGAMSFVSDPLHL